MARRLGLFDATMLVMGGIVGSGIFINPYVVAQQVHTRFLILGVWIIGGLVALTGSFVYAELSARLPRVGGQYAYLREAYHPAVAFVYGWCLLLVMQSGGMAAVAVTFAHYFLEIAGLAWSGKLVALGALTLLTLVNCLGVRAGGTVQSAMMVMKVAAIALLVAAGLAFGGSIDERPDSSDDAIAPLDLMVAIGAAMVPVLFAYGGWQTSCFVAEEMVEPRRNLPRALLAGVAGVILLYLSVNYVCLRVLGPQGLAATATPASAVMRGALGYAGARWIALGIAVSTFGFLSQGILTAPRVYFAMARDGLFFESIGRIHPRVRVPIIAIALQGLLAGIIAISGRYEQILNYVVSVDFIFFGLTGTCLFIFRRRGIQEPGERPYFAPGHPWTTVFFVAACWLVVLATIYRYPANSVIGLTLLLLGIPVFFIWYSKRHRLG